MKNAIYMSLAALVLINLIAGPAIGITEFKKAFKEKYVDPSSVAEFKKVVQKAGCNVCHINKQEKTERNEYGNELSKLIEGDVQERLKKATDEGRKKEELAKILGELEAAFPQVEEMTNAAGETYKSRIEAGKLPAEAP